MADTNEPKLAKNAGQELGRSGTLITGGIISLEEYNRLLVGKSALKQYDIMRRSDSTVRSTLQVVKLPIIAAKWNVSAAKIDDDEPDAKTKQELADYKARFIKRELFDRNVNFDKLLTSLLSSLEFGFDVEEKVFELTQFEGQTRIGMAKIDKRKQTTVLKWEDEQGNPGITQQLLGEIAYVPLPKLIVMTHDMEGENYEGISLLRYVYKDWDIKDKLTIVNAIANEKLALGIPVINEKENQTASEPDLTKARESVQNMRANEKSYMQMPASLSVEMLDMKSNSTKDVIPTLQYHDRRVTSAILAQFMELGGKSGSGSQALSKDLTSLFMKSEGALAKMIISTLQDQLVKQLCDFNFSDMSEGYPTVTVANLADDDIAAVSAATASLVTAGAITAEADLEEHLRDMMGFPKLPQEIKDNYPAKTPVQPATPGATEITVKDEKTLPTEKDNKTKAALVEAHNARRKLIDVLVS